MHAHTHTHKYTDERWLVISALVSGYMLSSIRHWELLYWDSTTHTHTHIQTHTLPLCLLQGWGDDSSRQKSIDVENGSV